MSRFFATPGVVVLSVLALTDMVTTLYWSASGRMVELNPLMRPLLETSPAAFAIAKLATVAALLAAVAVSYQGREQFCRTATAWGAGAYALIWSAWTALGNM